MYEYMETRGVSIVLLFRVVDMVTMDNHSLVTSERMKIISEAREKAKEMGFKLDVFGSPYGTTEGMVVIWKSDKHLDEFTVNSLIPFWYETRTVSVRNVG